jgi:hypothetical protein
MKYQPERFSREYLEGEHKYYKSLLNYPNGGQFNSYEREVIMQLIASIIVDVLDSAFFLQPRMKEYLLKLLNRVYLLLYHPLYDIGILPRVEHVRHLLYEDVFISLFL